MHEVGGTHPQWMPTLSALDDDENLAVRSAARLLITASAGDRVEALARRIHEASLRAAFPFVGIPAAELPVDPLMLRAACSSLLAAAAGGTVLISDVEEMPRVAQEHLIDLLARLESGRLPSAAVRLVAGTTVSLLDRIAAGTFSDRLFYRLNIIHLMTASAGPHSTALGGP